MMKRTSDFASSATATFLVVSLDPNLVVSAYIFFNRLSSTFSRFSSHDMHITHVWHVKDLRFTDKMVRGVDPHLTLPVKKHT